MTHPLMNDLFESTINEAYAAICADGFDSIHCCLTGSAIGRINEAEIHQVLKMEIQKNPLASADQLVDSFALHYLAINSRPAPSLQIHRDHSTLLRFMRVDASRTLAYLLGRLLFDSMVPSKEVDTLANRSAKLAFLIGLQGRLADLPAGWNRSLTPEDEEVQATLASIESEVDSETEGKNAQRCLESLLRLDAIHSLRHAINNAGLRDSLLAFQDTDSFSFTKLADTLREVEEDSIIRSRKSGQGLRSNAMALTAALESISWGQDRIASLSKKLESSHSTQIGQTVSNIVDFVSSLGIKDGTIKSIDKADMRELDRKLGRLNTSLDVKNHSKLKADLLLKTFAAAGESKGNVKVRKGSLETLAALLKDGVDLNPQTRAKIESAVKAGELKKSKTRKASGKPASKFAQNRNAFQAMFSSSAFAAHDSKKESK